MSAAPRPDHSRQPRDRRATSLLADALTDQAKQHEHASFLRSRVERALELNAEQQRYLWVTDDSREADMRVYFQVGGTFTVLAAELTRIDSQEPTLGEKLHYEQEFAAEMETGGDLWEDVASYAWERYHG